MQTEAHATIAGEKMPDQIEVAQAITIREAGLDEYWLQDQIADNPACLGLGDLQLVSKERAQSSGGRLDLLLKDSEDDTMFEVEVMLGETDETHIIRTIEYWDNEKRRWPQRQHFAVLVAEHINRRFFNVIHLLSHSIPIIAVQVAMLNVNGRKSIFFSKVLDTYEEVDDGTSNEAVRVTRDDWSRRAKWTLEAADALVNITSSVLGQPNLNYVGAYVAITVDGNNYMWLHKRSSDKSLLTFRMAQSLQDEATALLDAQNITYVRKTKSIKITVDKDMIERNAELFRKIADLTKKSWQGGL
ncbi:hypothetical protein JQ544_11490 [Bradyrhizobium diazoefficiens]|nr:hypothetical protein [Bradyrhizobium diazoefficiens]MBR0812150.1 hypothetical protein [Bradyrhizobium diazoefficiens]